MGIATRNTFQSARPEDYLPAIAVGGTASSWEEMPPIITGSSKISLIAEFYEKIIGKKYTFMTPVMNDSTAFLPNRIPLIGNLLEGWDLIQPVLVHIEREDDGLYVVGDDIFYVHGAGDTFQDALYDYKVSLTEYYQIVEARLEGKPKNAQLFEKIRHYIHKI